jgi:1-phosphatidylinositol phosphodiesterase
MEKVFRKHVIIASSLGVIALVGTAISFLHFGTSSSTHSDWMASLNDQTDLCSIAIPGSHDSAALYSVGDLAGKCQNASLSEQLSYGVRFFDIRLKNYQDNLYLWHGFINEGQTFSEAAKVFSDFLTVHPKEALIISIKEEEKAQGNSLSFETLLKQQTTSSIWYLDRQMPSTLGAVRGKAILLARYSGNTMGIDSSEEAGWLNPSDAATSNTFSITSTDSLFIQDHYKLNDNDTKWAEATAFYEALQKMNTKSLGLNFYSGYLVKGFPPSYSVSTAKAINAKILSSLPSWHKSVVIVDFVTPALVDKILEGNV